MNVTLVRVLRIAAAVCFLTAWFIATSTSDSWINPLPWELAGLFILTVSFIP